MSFERPDAGKSLVSYQRKTEQEKRPFPLSSETNDQDRSPTVTEEGDDNLDNASIMETEDDEEAALRWQELRAAMTEEDEIRRYNELRTRNLTRTEAQHDEDLHNLRLRRMRERRIARETESRAAQASDAVKEATSEIQQQGTQAADSPKRGRDRVSEHTGPPLPRSETPSGNRQTSWVPPSLKRTDVEVFTTPMKEPSPPPNTHWRDPQRQRRRLNLDFSRIDTHFLLSHEFIDDVNTMLDFINGWPEYQFDDIKYAFQKDWMNRDRTIEFVDLGNGNRRWGVRLLNPLNTSRRDSGMYCPFTSSENPFGRCQSFGRDQGCPNKVSMEQRIADLENFREQRSLLPSPIPSRSNKRKTLRGPPEVAKPLLPPVTPAPLAATPPPPDSPRPEFRPLPDAQMEAEYIEDVECSESSLWKQVNQVKPSMAQFKDQSQGTQGPQAGGREMAKEWLQKSKLVSETSKATVKRSLIDSGEIGHIGGKLVHDEKIPTGPNSLRRTDLFFTSKTDSRRVTALGPLVEQVQNKPREDYYAAANTAHDESSSEDDTTATSSSPGMSEQSSIDLVIQSVFSSTTPNIKFCPQYLKDPVAY